MDPAKYNSQMQNIAYGEAFMAAARDYKDLLVQEEEEGQRNSQAAHGNVAVRDLFDDPELERLHGERLAKLRECKEKRAAMERKGHGSYEEVSEASFFDISTSTDKVVAHFSHPDFERCTIMAKHLKVLSTKYFDTRFVQVSVQDAPFLVKKLQIRMLPCVVCFQGGIAGERLVGFDTLGKRDDFQTGTLEKVLLGWNIVDPIIQANDEELSGIRKGYCHNAARTQSDEDSDFD